MDSHGKVKIGDIVCIVWEDAKAQMDAELREFLEGGLSINTSVGWVRFIDSKILVLSSNKSHFSHLEDLFMIPRIWIKEINILQMKN